MYGRDRGAVFAHTDVLLLELSGQMALQRRRSALDQQTGERVGRLLRTFTKVVFPVPPSPTDQSTVACNKIGRNRHEISGYRTSGVKILNEVSSASTAHRGG